MIRHCWPLAVPALAADKYAIKTTKNAPPKDLKEAVGKLLEEQSTQLTDDKGAVPAFVSGDADGDKEIDPGETWVYQATGTAVVGQYANTATVNALDALEEPLTATDPSHYLGFGSVSPSTLPAVGNAARAITPYALVVIAAGAVLAAVASRRRAPGR